MFCFLLNMCFSKYSALRKYSVCLVFCLSLLLLEYATPVARCSCRTRLLSGVQLIPIQSNSVPALMANGGLHRGVRYINFWKKKGTGDFERCRQTMDKLSLVGTSHCLFWLFLIQKYPFLDQPGPGMTPGWGIKVPNTYIIIAWGVFWPIFQFPG